MKKQSNAKKRISTKAKILVAGLCIAMLIVSAIFARPLYRFLRDLNDYPVTYSDLVEKWSNKYEVDPAVVMAVIRTESGFDPKAQSPVGARGLMQLTDSTFLWLKQKIAPNEQITFDDMYSPDENIRFGTYLLSISLARYGGDVPTMAAAYHSGWGTVDGLLRQPEYSPEGIILTKFPFERMNHYVGKINKSYQRYVAIYASKKTQ